MDAEREDRLGSNMMSENRVGSLARETEAVEYREGSRLLSICTGSDGDRDGFSPCARLVRLSSLMLHRSESAGSCRTPGIEYALLRTLT